MLAGQTLYHLSHLPGPLSDSSVTTPSSVLPPSQAMDLEVPVLARNIPGNSAVVEHGVTGLLFTTPQVKRALSATLASLVRFLSVCVKDGHKFGFLVSLSAPAVHRGVRQVLWFLFSLWREVQHLEIQGTSDLTVLAQWLSDFLGMHKPGVAVGTCHRAFRR